MSFQKAACACPQTVIAHRGGQKPYRQKIVQTMGHKKVCFNCKKAFSLGTDFSVKHSSTCPECGQPTSVLQHSFRPPSRDDIKSWKVVEFLKDHGFLYQHIYKDISKKNGIVSYQNYVDYPTTMDQAKDFVQKYKDQAADI